MVALRKKTSEIVRVAFSLTLQRGELKKRLLVAKTWTSSPTGSGAYSSPNWKVAGPMTSARSPRLRPVLRLLRHAASSAHCGRHHRDLGLPAIAWDSQYTHSAVVATVAVLLTWWLFLDSRAPPRVPVRTAPPLQPLMMAFLLWLPWLQHPARHPYPHAAVLSHAGVHHSRFRC